MLPGDRQRLSSECCDAVGPGAEIDDPIRRALARVADDVDAEMRMKSKEWLEEPEGAR